MIKVCLLGASGSIGQQAIQILKKNPDDFELVGFSVGKRSRYIRGIVNHFPHVKYICVLKNRQAKYYRKQFPKIKFFVGDNGLIDLLHASRAKMCINALVGFVGVKPTLEALKMNKKLCLANKESLVVAGELVKKLLAKGKGKLYPIDSEHCAISKCLAVDKENVDKIILTASGGSLRGLKRSELKNVTKEQALNHPTWKMGAKITLDSATMVNKTFEIIEAYYLFGFKTNRIDVLMHDESIVHSMVRYQDGKYRADVGKPDMRKCIKYAMYEGNIPFDTALVDDYRDFKNLHFKTFSLDRYPVVRWAQAVIDRQGIAGAVLNAASEAADKAYLEGKIPFLDIEYLIDYCMYTFGNRLHPSYEQLKRCDRRTRNLVKKLIRDGGYR